MPGPSSFLNGANLPLHDPAQQPPPLESFSPFSAWFTPTHPGEPSVGISLGKAFPRLPGECGLSSGPRGSVAALHLFV